jgi:hypothetical protein
MVRRQIRIISLDVADPKVAYVETKTAIDSYSGLEVVVSGCAVLDYGQKVLLGGKNV